MDRNTKNKTLDTWANEISNSGKEKRYVSDFDSNEDIFMGEDNSADVLRGCYWKPLRARQKSPEQLKRLKEEGRCYDSERKDYSTKICRV